MDSLVELAWCQAATLKYLTELLKPYAHPVNGVAIVTVKTQENMREIHMHWEPEISIVKSEHKAL